MKGKKFHRRHPDVSGKVPLIALVGRPNVGKSTLFNRLSLCKDALVHDEPGVTRDRRYGWVDYGGFSFNLVDTGGIDETQKKGILGKVIDQSLVAIDEADLVLFVVDGQVGLHPQDEHIQKILYKKGKPVWHIINKADGRKHSLNRDFFKLGGQKFFEISAAHGRGISQLLDEVVEFFTAQRAPTLLIDTELETAVEEPALIDGLKDSSNESIRLAFLGRPNAGKSSLINAFLKENRMIVDETAGTTRDSIEVAWKFMGRDYVLVDTAGIRRKSRVAQDVEKLSVVMAQKAIAQSDIVALIIDANGGIGEQDAKIISMVQEEGKALLLVFNKMDLLSKENRKKIESDKERILHFVPWADWLFCSAKTGRNLSLILRRVAVLYQSYTKRISTGELNRFLAKITEQHPPPVSHGKPLRLYYITQIKVKPPTFLLSVNYPQGVHFSYERYLQNQIRETFGYQGVPIHIVPKEHRSR